MDGPPAQHSRPPMPSLATHPCPRCGAAGPLGGRLCPNCAFPQPIRSPGGLPALLITRGAFILVSVVFGWPTPPAAHAARATATVQIRSALPGTPAGKTPGAFTRSIQPAEPAAGTPQALATR